MGFFKRFMKGDMVIWIIFILLSFYSLVFVYSATSTMVYKTDIVSPIFRHFIMLVVGLFIGVFVPLNIYYTRFKFLGLILPIMFIVLLITLKWGVVINGERRWLDICGFQFQPSEIAKLSLVVFIAFVLSKRVLFTDMQRFVIVLVGTTLICSAIFPANGSTAFLLFVFSVMMMFIGQIPLRIMIRFCLVILSIFAMSFVFLKFAPENVMKVAPDRLSTWKSRIENFSSDEPMVEENGQIKDEYFQVVHSQIAIAQGGLFGKGPGYGDQRDVLPQAYSDFIFAIILEESGLILGMILLCLYFVLIVRVGMIAKRCNNFFAKYLVIGCGLLLGLQALTNLAVSVHLIPVTGQPLPLVSRGGTSTIISCFYIGIILSVSRFGANIGNEKDDFPEDEKADENKVVQVTISEEDVENWVPDVSKTQKPTNT